ncbi:GH17853 [Drosophila grimshawi]|uniref:GH17853 n=1 Tax=Drosophila grimshawi TaxID=7222 RepID=B4JWZ7_DROGR|nr:GH17853 [Drosophila grimshawi]
MVSERLPAVRDIISHFAQLQGIRMRMRAAPNVGPMRQFGPMRCGAWAALITSSGKLAREMRYQYQQQ